MTQTTPRGRCGRMEEAEMETFSAAGQAQALGGKERGDRKKWAVERSWDWVAFAAASLGIFSAAQQGQVMATMKQEPDRVERRHGRAWREG